jgi:hypothetical protein
MSSGADLGSDGDTAWLLLGFHALDRLRPWEDVWVDLGVSLLAYATVLALSIKAIFFNPLVLAFTFFSFSSLTMSFFVLEPGAAHSVGGPPVWQYLG